ncbi:MAG: M3 family oligoendopeptidase [Bacilli bacterium]
MSTWNLNALYLGFDDPNFTNDVEKFKVTVEKALAYSHTIDDNDNYRDVLYNLLKLFEELELVAGKVFAYISLNLSSDTGNVTAQNYRVQLQQYSAKITLLNSKLLKYVAQIPNLDDVINSDEFLKAHSFIIREQKEFAKHQMEPELEVLATRMSQNGSSLFNQMQRYLTSTAEIEFRGKLLSLSEIRNLASDSDPEIRKQAYEAELQIYKKIEDAMSFAINGIKGEVNTLTEMRGFENVLEEALLKSRLKKETLDSLLEAMRDYLPEFRKYLRRKAEILGHQNGLPWYDLFAPMGASSTKYSIEEAQEFILNNFATFSEDLRNLAKRAFEEEWIDYFPRKGKVGGAFCNNLRAIKQSRILTNFTGSIGDVVTLAHELGHAYHGDQIFNESILNSAYTMPVAETASTLCETIAKKAAFKAATNDDEKLHILETELQDSTQVIVDIYSRYLFESNLFEARKSSIPNAKRLNEMMLESQKEAYGDGLDPEYLNSGMWICKSHYYSGYLSFYNFPYAFGLLFAKGIYAKFLEQGQKFVAQVNKLLRLTGQMTVEDAAKTVGIDVTDPTFWRNGLEVIKEDISYFLKITEDKVK